MSVIHKAVGGAAYKIEMLGNHKLQDCGIVFAVLEGTTEVIAALDKNIALTHALTMASGFCGLVNEDRVYLSFDYTIDRYLVTSYVPLARPTTNILQEILHPATREMILSGQIQRPDLHEAIPMEQYRSPQMQLGQNPIQAAVQMNPIQAAAQMNPIQAAAQMNPIQAAAQMNPIQAAAQMNPIQAAAQMNPIQDAVQMNLIQAAVQMNPIQGAVQAEGNGDDGNQVQIENQVNASGRGRRNNPAHIPRPRNMWILYRMDKSRELRQTNPELKTGEISQLVSQMWAQESAEVRQVWADKAKEEALEHKRKYPNYRYLAQRRRPAANQD